MRKEKVVRAELALLQDPSPGSTSPQVVQAELLLDVREILARVEKVLDQMDRKLGSIASHGR